MEHAKSKKVADKICYTIQQFCSSHQISRDTYDRLQREGRGPNVIRLSKRKILIPLEAASEWLNEQMEANNK